MTARVSGRICKGFDKKSTSGLIDPLHGGELVDHSCFEGNGKGRAKNQEKTGVCLKDQKDRKKDEKANDS